jgi:cytochrome c
LIAAGAVMTAAPLAAEEGEYGVLFEAPGVEETFYTCSACHSEKLVAQQGMTRDRWDHLLDWMIEEQGMAELEPEDRAIILDYLSTHYGPDRPHFPQH